MNWIEDILKQRESFLKSKKEQLEKELRKLPEGTLNIFSIRGKSRYYYKDCSLKTRKYLNKKDLPLAMRLAQKQYDMQVLQSINQEISAINRYQQSVPDVLPEDVYLQLPDSRKNLVTPVADTDELFVRKWMEIKYTGNSFPKTRQEYVTERNEIVRSKSEWMIANMLFHEGVPYKYECPVYLHDKGEIYPDFTVLNVRKRKELYWEHFGIMDQSDYAENAVEKISDYVKNGYYPGNRLIMTFETEAHPLNVLMVKDYIRYFCK